MKILYIGNFQPWWSTETHLAATLESLGHDVVRLQESECSAEQAIEQANLEIRACDQGMLLWTRTWGLLGGHEAGRKVLRAFDGAGIPTVAYHLDLYAGLERARLVSEEPWWRSNFVFTPDGGSDEFWKKHGVNHYYMPPGVYAPDCKLVDPDPADVCDVAFVGSYEGYHQEWPYRKILVDYLRARYGPRFRCYTHASRRRGDSLNRLYASAKVIVGDAICIGFDHAGYWSDRLPETLGRGGFLIHPRIEGIEEGGLRHGEHLLLYDYGRLGYLGNMIDLCLADGSYRRKIRDAGHEEVKKNHTYTQRMEAMMKVVFP